MADVVFQSPDRRFGLRIASNEVERMVSLCRKAKRNEIGGILTGRYTDEHDWAEVTDATGPPEDSRSGRTWFERGVRGLQQLINQCWKRDRSYYLGEWHYHPYAGASPSRTDIAQMKKISEAESYQCPEPILLILGGDPVGALDIRAFIFARNNKYIELTKINFVSQSEAR